MTPTAGISGAKNPVFFFHSVKNDAEKKRVGGNESSKN